jgi:hypothetical protein
MIPDAPSLRRPDGNRRERSLALRPQTLRCALPVTVPPRAHATLLPIAERTIVLARPTLHGVPALPFPIAAPS